MLVRPPAPTTAPKAAERTRGRPSARSFTRPKQKGHEEAPEEARSGAPAPVASPPALARYDEKSVPSTTVMVAPGKAVLCCVASMPSDSATPSAAARSAAVA